MKTYISIIFLFFTTFLSGQETLFKVFFYNGDIQYKYYQLKEWNNLNRINFTFMQSDSISLGEQSELYLFDNEGRQLHLSHPGKYEIIAMSDSIKKQGSKSLFTRYVQFIWEELNTPDKNIEQYADRYMKEKGGVSRAVNIPLIISPFYGTYILENQIDFKWENTGEKYTLSFWDSDNNGRGFLSIAIEDTTATLSTKLPWIPKDKIFYYSITENDKPATNFIPIKVPGKEKKEKILQGVNSIKESFPEKGEAMLLLLAAFYEKNNLLEKAESSYLEAIKLNPGNKILWDYYELFLARMGIHSKK
jgi:hypothetical protein